MAIFNLLVVLFCGALFGFGLSFATMIEPESVLTFLRLEDFGLVLVLGCSAGLATLTYQLAPRLTNKPLNAACYEKKSDIPLKRTLVGAMIFGLGWGINGVCPGPAIAGLGTGNWPLLIVVTAMLAGSYVQGRWFPNKD